MRVVGFEPGLRNTGWGVIESDGTHLHHVANGTVKTDSNRDLAERLVQLHDGVAEVLRDLRPDQAAVEMTLVNKNATSNAGSPNQATSQSMMTKRPSPMSRFFGL